MANVDLHAGVVLGGDQRIGGRAEKKKKKTRKKKRKESEQNKIFANILFWTLYKAPHTKPLARNVQIDFLVLGVLHFGRWKEKKGEKKKGEVHQKRENNPDFFYFKKPPSTGFWGTVGKVSGASTDFGNFARKKKEKKRFGF